MDMPAHRTISLLVPCAVVFVSILLAGCNGTRELDRKDRSYSDRPTVEVHTVRVRPDPSHTTVLATAQAPVALAVPATRTPRATPESPATPDVVRRASPTPIASAEPPSRIELEVLGRVEIEVGPLVDVAVIDEVAYLAIGGQGGGVAVMDIDDPSALSVRSFRPVPSEANKTDVEAIATDGRLLFVGVDWYAGRTPHEQKEGPFALVNAIHVLDAWDPALPEVRRREVTDEHCGGSNACGPDGISEMPLHDEQLFVAYSRGGVMLSYVSSHREGAAPGFSGAASYAVVGVAMEHSDAMRSPAKQIASRNSRTSRSSTSRCRTRRARCCGRSGLVGACIRTAKTSC